MVQEVVAEDPEAVEASALGVDPEAEALEASPPTVVAAEVAVEAIVGAIVEAVAEAVVEAEASAEPVGASLHREASRSITKHGDHGVHGETPSKYTMDFS